VDVFGLLKFAGRNNACTKAARERQNFYRPYVAAKEASISIFQPITMLISNDLMNQVMNIKPSRLVYSITIRLLQLLRVELQCTMEETRNQTYTITVYP